MRTWESMRARIRAQLERQSGHDTETWKNRIAARAMSDEATLRTWLAEEGVRGYPQTLLVRETFGYPDFLLASADELVDAQYADRPGLRPVFDAVVATVSGFGHADVQARKTYVSLLTPKRTFAVAQATTRTRLDLGLRLAAVEPHGRLLPARSVGNDAITLRFALATADDVDDECLAWLRRAYDESC